MEKNKKRAGKRRRRGFGKGKKGRYFGFQKEK